MNRQTLFAIEWKILMETGLISTDISILVYMWQMEHAGTIHGSCDIAVDMPPCCASLEVLPVSLPILRSSSWHVVFFYFESQYFWITSHMPSTLLALCMYYLFNNIYCFQLKILYFTVMETKTQSYLTHCYIEINWINSRWWQIKWKLH